MKKKLMGLLLSLVVMVGMFVGGGQASAYTVQYPDANDGSVGAYGTYGVGNILQQTQTFKYSLGTNWNFVGNMWNSIDNAYEKDIIGSYVTFTSPTTQNFMLYLQRWTGSRWVDAAHTGVTSTPAGYQNQALFRNEYSSQLLFDTSITQYAPKLGKDVTGYASSNPHHSQVYRYYFSNPNATSTVTVSFHKLGTIPALMAY